MTGGCRPLQSALRSPSSLGNCPNKLSSLSLISPIKGRAARNEGCLRTLPPSGIRLRDCILSVCSRRFQARACRPAGERERPSEHCLDRTVQGFLASSASRGLARNIHISVEVDRGATTGRRYSSQPTACSWCLFWIRSSTDGKWLERWRLAF